MIKYQVSASLLSNGRDFKIERRNPQRAEKSALHPGCTKRPVRSRTRTGRGRGQPFNVEVQHAVDPCCTVLHVCMYPCAVRYYPTPPSPYVRTLEVGSWNLEAAWGPSAPACLPATKFFSSLLNGRRAAEAQSTCDGWTFLDQLRSGQSSKNPHRASGRVRDGVTPCRGSVVRRC